MRGLGFSLYRVWSVHFVQRYSPFSVSTLPKWLDHPHKAKLVLYSIKCRWIPPQIVERRPNAKVKTKSPTTNKDIDDHRTRSWAYFSNNSRNLPSPSSSGITPIAHLVLLGQQMRSSSGIDGTTWINHHTCHRLDSPVLRRTLHPEFVILATLQAFDLPLSIGGGMRRILCAIFVMPAAYHPIGPMIACNTEIFHSA